MNILYKFSVIIPAHNEEKYIDKCLKSILNASEYVTDNVEIIVVANRCTDKTELIAKHYGAEESGTNPKFDRMSIGIAFSAMYVAFNLIPVMMKNKGYLSGAMFWCYKKDFDAVGGFDESLVSLEDMDFAVKLKNHGNRKLTKCIFTGKDRKAADEFYYDVR